MDVTEARELTPITPTETFDLDSVSVSAIAKEKGFLVEI